MSKQKRILTEEEKENIAKAKQELNEYRDNIKYIDEKQQDIEELRTRLERTTSKLSLNKTFSKGASKDTLSEGVSKLEDIEQDYIKKLEELLLKKFIIDEKIDKLKEPYRSILFFRYARCNSWSEIASIIDYGIDNTFKLHGKALYLYSTL